MEIPLNAMEEDDRDNAPPPAFTIPMRGTSGNTVSLSSLLSSDQGEHEHDEHQARRESSQYHQHQQQNQEERVQRFETNVTPIAVPQPQQQQQQQQQPPLAHRQRPRGGLANLMNSPMDEDVIMQDPRGHIVGTMSITTESPGGGLTQIHHTQQEAVEAQSQEQQQLEPVRVEVVEEEEQQQPQDIEVDAGAHHGGEVTASPRSTSDSPVPNRQRKQSLIEINIQSVVLNDQDLENLKMEFQSAIQKYLVAEAKGDSGAPSAKRQKKGKHARKAKPSMTTDESIAEIQKCIQLLNQKVGAQLESSNALTEVVQFCLSFCSVLNEKDSIEKIIVKQKKPLPHGSSDSATANEIEVNYDATLAALIQKPLYYQLLLVIRRAVFCCSAQDVTVVLSQVLEWCLASSSPAHWMWVLAFLAQNNSFSVVEFLFHELLFKQADNETACQFTIPIIEYLESKNQSQLVDIVRDLLEEAASEDVHEINGKPVPWVVKRLVSVATEFPVFLRACDDSLQFFVTKEFVASFAPKFYSQSGKPNKDDDQLNGGESADLSLFALVLVLLKKRFAELSYSGFQLVLLLQGLATATSDGEKTQSSPRVQLAEAASALQRQMLVVAEREESRVLLRGIYRFLPYICQSTLRSLRSSKQGEKESNDQAFDQWRAWLELIARYISKAEVTQHLIEADLMLSEVGEGESPSPTSIRQQDLKLCGLLSSILTPLSVDYVQFAKEMMNSCNASAPRGQQRRVLAILQALLSVNEHEVQSSTDQADHLPIELSVTADLTIEDAVDQVLSIDSWSQSWKRFELWKGTQGVNFWEGFMDLACSRNPEVASRALELISQTPFQSLEDPIWQYRCLRKLTTVFFHLLRQYRADVVNAGNRQTLTEKGSETQGRLEKLKVAFFRLLALDGGVAHYPSSVYSTFVSLWVDALFSTNSPTSIPTHFPNRVNFSSQGEIEDRIVIRSERTISSKCTNLQSSKVITQFLETLVYRKALDSSWEREMDAAHTCCMYATDLLFQLLCTSVTTGRAASGGRRGVAGDNDNEYIERKLKAVVDLLLERAIPCCGIPSDEVYKETLPNRSSFDMDLRTEQWLNHFPAFLPLLRAAVTTSASVNSSQSLRLVPLVKSALIVLLGHWNSVKGELSLENMDVPPYMRNRNQLALTCELVQILRLTGWLPAPLGRTAELLPLTSPADIRGILFSCWFYLSDHPPSETATGPTPASSRTASPISATSSPAVSAAGGGGNHANVPLEFYLIPLRKALHNNIQKIGAKYPLYMC